MTQLSRRLVALFGGALGVCRRAGRAIADLLRRFVALFGPAFEVCRRAGRAIADLLRRFVALFGPAFEVCRRAGRMLVDLLRRFVALFGPAFEVCRRAGRMLVDLLRRFVALFGPAFEVCRRAGRMLVDLLRRRRGRRFFGRALEIPAAFMALLFLLSLGVAFAIYYEVQRVTQERLAQAYMGARFVTEFCDDRVAFDRELCEKNADSGRGMSWQQIHSLLTEAKVLDAAGAGETETPTDLEELYENSNNPQDRSPLHDLLKELRPPEIQDDGDTEPETSLAFIYRLAQKQCVSGTTVETKGRAPDKERIKDPTAFIEAYFAATRAQSPTYTRAELIQRNVAYALSDTFGGLVPGDLGIHGDVRPGGGSDTDQNSYSLWGWHDTSARCDRAREQLSRIGEEPQPPAMSGLRFSTERCLSDSAILSELTGLQRAIALHDDAVTTVSGEAEPGYRLGKPCLATNDRQEYAFLRMEAFTGVMQYALGVTHATREVRSAQKYANLVRGPEHIGILALGLFALSLLAVRCGALLARLARYRRQGRAGPMAELVENLAAGGHRAERQLDALARGRTLVRWSIATAPALGFIGTVRGILEALARAGDVVWAADRLERADAIGQLAGELGLAFSTTFFALLVGVVLGLFSALSRSHEERRIDDLVENATREERT